MSEIKKKEISPCSSQYYKGKKEKFFELDKYIITIPEDYKYKQLGFLSLLTALRYNTHVAINFFETEKITKEELECICESMMFYISLMLEPFTKPGFEYTYISSLHLFHMFLNRLISSKESKSDIVEPYKEDCKTLGDCVSKMKKLFKNKDDILLPYRLDNFERTWNWFDIEGKCDMTRTIDKLTMD